MFYRHNRSLHVRFFLSRIDANKRKSKYSAFTRKFRIYFYAIFMAAAEGFFFHFRFSRFERALSWCSISRQNIYTQQIHANCSNCVLASEMLVFFFRRCLTRWAVVRVNWCTNRHISSGILITPEAFLNFISYFFADFLLLRQPVDVQSELDSMESLSESNIWIRDLKKKNVWRLKKDVVLLSSSFEIESITMDLIKLFKPLFR